MRKKEKKKENTTNPNTHTSKQKRNKQKLACLGTSNFSSVTNLYLTPDKTVKQ